MEAGKRLKDERCVREGLAGLAKAGNADAMHVLGERAWGEGRREVAKRWWRQAVSKGSREAGLALAGLALTQRGSDPESRAFEAMEWIVGQSWKKGSGEGQQATRLVETDTGAMQPVD